MRGTEEYEVEVYLNSFETPAPNWGEWSPSGPGRFIPDKEAAGTQRKGDRFGHIAGVNTGNFLALHRFETKTPVLSSRWSSHYGILRLQEFKLAF